MHSIFKEVITEAVLLIDAGNAFNSVKRNVFLHKIVTVCPAKSTYVFNCYARPSRPFVFWGYKICPVEGTTQEGYPIDMPIHAIAVVPLYF